MNFHVVARLFSCQCPLGKQPKQVVKEYYCLSPQLLTEFAMPISEHSEIAKSIHGPSHFRKHCLSFSKPFPVAALTTVVHDGSLQHVSIKLRTEAAGEMMV